MKSGNALLDEIEELYIKLEPYVKEYKASTISYKRIVRKLGRHDPEFLKVILQFFKDLWALHLKIAEITEAPLARTPGYWENYKIMFGHTTNDREYLPELDKIEGRKKLFRSFVTGFVKTHRDHYKQGKKYENKAPEVHVEKTQQPDSDNQV